MTPGSGERKRRAFALALAAALSAPGAARASEPPDAGRAWASCTEHLPPGASRPAIDESFPTRGTSGHASFLEVTVRHGKGETVLPEGFKLQSGSDAARALDKAGFVIPDPAGGAAPSLTTEPGEAQSTTKLAVPFVPLPDEPGRSAMLLPPVPIAIARASGEVVTLCTRPHPIVVDDPIASTVDPKVLPNPEPGPQREEWVLAKQLTMGLAIGAVVALLSAWALNRWMKRPKPIVVVPKRPPWLAALEELERIRRSELLAEQRTDAYFDRVSDCVRQYLGERYGFDGLESTTDEMRILLARVRPPVAEMPRIVGFLAECDLVKFARVEPTEKDCLDALDQGEAIVRRTIPPREAGSRAEAPSRGAVA